ncbi:lantibiotic dehydratase [Deinococcus sp. KNUC1210]|uniref:lantibiotic dehydratase n=1 Tax=Deinococcus sp. KNUC1210 TaxID=2917691 RepID=UPI0021067D43|nr:lantibiotic dehydratase [Deinococcus sp. KNUC1210]
MQHPRPGHVLTALCLQHPAAAANDTARCWPGTPLELHVPGHPSVRRSRRVDVSRLQIRCRAGQTEVWCGERGQRLQLHLPTLTRADQLGPTARFLVQLALQGHQPPRWHWGNFSGRSVLPRITRGHCVLSAARWRFPDAWRTAGDLSDQQLQRWIETVQLPDLVQIGRSDRQLTLDLGHAVHRDLLRAEWRSGASSLREALATPAQAWFEGHDGQRHLFEGVWTVRRA